MDRIFEVGKTYKTRDGRDARVICIDRNCDYPIVILLKTSNTHEAIMSLTSNGYRYRDSDKGYILGAPEDLMTPNPKTKKVKLLAYFYDKKDQIEELRYFSDNGVPSNSWKRVPSKDEEIEVSDED